MKNFKKIYIEITNVCNLKCSFCPETKRAPQFMSVEKFTAIMEKIKGYTAYIYLHVKGEPMLHPQFDEIIAVADKYRYKINITTNGTFISKWRELLLNTENVRQLNVSIHSHINEDCSKGSDSYFDEILSFAHEVYKRGKPYLAFRLWNLSVENFENSENKAILNRIEKEFSMEENSCIGKIDSKGVRISDNVFVNFDTKFEWPEVKEKEENCTGYCFGLIEHVAILVDGSVVPCCLDGNGTVVLGNIFESDFKDIIKSERARRIKEGFLNRKIVEELCKGCTFKDRF